jgi:ABC-type Mn2+/Zn2+ transport system ATPase subunit
VTPVIEVSDLEFMLSFTDVSVGYRGRAIREHVSLQVRRGDFLGIAGANGAGKTTILKTLLGILPRLAGRVHRDPSARIAYVPQRERIDTIIPVTALEVAVMGRIPALALSRRVGHEDRARAREALRRVGVEPLASRLFRDLSGGEQQLVLVARALAGDPDLLVLDEPTMAMDLAHEHALMELLRQLNREGGLTIVLVTHLLPLLMNLATTMLLLRADTIVAGPTHEVLTEEILAALYGVAVRVVTIGGRRALVVGAPDA